MNVAVKMVRDFAPELMQVSCKLQKALGVRWGTRGFLLHKLWEYTKGHSTPEKSDPAVVQADSELIELLGEKRLMLGTLGQKMDPFLSHPEPVELHYSIMLDGPSPCTPLCFDIDVAWSLRQEMLVLPPFLDRLDVKTQLLEHDRKIAGGKPWSTEFWSTEYLDGLHLPWAGIATREAQDQNSLVLLVILHKD